MRDISAIWNPWCDYLYTLCSARRSPVCRIGQVYIAWLPDMVSMDRISTLLLLCSFCSGVVVSTLTSNNTLSGELRTACRRSDTWITPQWPPSVIWNCRNIIDRLGILEPESATTFEQEGDSHAFMRQGLRPPYPVQNVVRTPWKLTNGTNFFLSFFPPLSHGSSSF